MKKMIQRLIFIAMLGLLAVGAQAQTKCFSGFHTVSPCEQVTDEVYWASKDPKVVEVHRLESIAARIDAATKLTAQGFIIDFPVDVWGWSPTLTMKARGDYGLPWVPSFGQPDLVDPLRFGVLPSTCLAPCAPTDMTKPWPRSIMVSTFAPDYPPLTPPQPAPVADGITWNYDKANGVYQVVQAAVVDVAGKWIYSEGQPLRYEGQTVYFHLSYSIMGVWPQFLVKKP